MSVQPNSRTNSALELFIMLAEERGLRFTYDTEGLVELTFKVPRQRDLSFDMTLMLQNVDELWIQLDVFIGSYFPYPRQDVRDAFETDVRGLIDGNCRVIAEMGRSGKLIGSRLQRSTETGWTDLSRHGYGLLSRFRRIRSIEIIRNGP